MHIAALNRKVIDVAYRAPREAEVDQNDELVDGGDPGCTEILEESHIEVAKVFLELDDNEVEKNSGIPELNYYELSIDPENASLKKVV